MLGGAETLGKPAPSPFAAGLGQRARDLVLSHQGATLRTVTLIEALLDGRQAARGSTATKAA